jgi:hypothetical protein
MDNSATSARKSYNSFAGKVVILPNLPNRHWLALAGWNNTAGFECLLRRAAIADNEIL